MGNASHKTFTVKQVLLVQVIISFIVIGILLAAAGALVFSVMGKDYSQFTVFGFIATTYLAFITFQPAGTLFAARKELIEGKVNLNPDDIRAAGELVRSPWQQTLPAGFIVALLSIAVVAAVIFGTGWKPTPVVTVLLALLYVFPHYLITKRFIGSDLATMAAVGLGSSPPVPSLRWYFWGAYVFPNLMLQFIINVALANRGFSQEMLKLARQGSEYVGMVPTVAVGVDLTFTFMFVCNFTFLGTIMYVISDMFLGKFTYGGNARGIHGFLYFIIMLLMGLGIGVGYISSIHSIGVTYMSFAHAMLSKFAIVFVAVSLGSRLAMGWTGKRVNDAVAAIA
jgi:hypothetical protein